jgi:hypothetical protein
LRATDGNKKRVCEDKTHIKQTKNESHMGRDAIRIGMLTNIMHTPPHISHLAISAAVAVVRADEIMTQDQLAGGCCYVLNRDIRKTRQSRSNCSGRLLIDLLDSADKCGAVTVVIM